MLTAADELAAFAERVQSTGRVALDTEFVWERTYHPVLGIVQLAIEDECVLVDAQALPDLAPLFPVLRDPAVPVVLHGGGQDLAILAQMMGAPVLNVVDTQIVAAFLGYGAQIGLSVLLDRVLKVHIRKDQTYTDWVRRPLKPEQLAYALVDVQHLLELDARLRAELEQRNRQQWVEEELRLLEEPTRYAAPPDDRRYTSVKGWQRLDGEGLAVLRPLAAWREHIARRANIRPNFVMSDIVLTTIAARPPKTVEDLRDTRGLSKGTVDRYGRDVMEAIELGRACPRDEWPVRPDRTQRQPSGLIALLRTAVQAVAAREKLAAELIATGRDLDALAAAKTEAVEPDIAVLQGWRRELVGDTLQAIARGEVAIRYDPERREILLGK